MSHVGRWDRRSDGGGLAQLRRRTSRHFEAGANNSRCGQNRVRCTGVFLLAVGMEMQLR